MAKTITAAFLAMGSLLCRAQVSETRATGNFSKIEVASGIGLAYSESSEVSVLAEAATQESLEGIVTEVKDPENINNLTYKVYLDSNRYFRTRMFKEAVR